MLGGGHMEAPWEIRIIFSTNIDNYIVYFYVLLTLLMKQVWVVIERTVQFSCDNHLIY